jgi:hypothetical protein
MGHLLLGGLGFMEYSEGGKFWGLLERFSELAIDFLEIYVANGTFTFGRIKFYGIR